MRNFRAYSARTAVDSRNEPVTAGHLFKGKSGAFVQVRGYFRSL